MNIQTRPYMHFLGIRLNKKNTLTEPAATDCVPLSVCVMNMRCRIMAPFGMALSLNIWLYILGFKV